MLPNEMNDAQKTLDAEHLRLLKIFHYIVAGLGYVLSFLPTIYLGIGIAMLLGKLPHKPDEPDMSWAGWFMVGIGSFLFVLALAWSTAVFLAGRHLKERRGYIFCTVVAGIECCFTPFGTVLGVLTLIVLSRPSVRELFGHASVSPASPPVVTGHA